MSQDEGKIRLRRRARAARRERHNGQSDAVSSDRLADNFFSAMSDMKIPPTGTIAGYWPVGGEIDVRPLMLRLHRSGYRCLLPVVEAAGKPLVFRIWRPDDTLYDNHMGIPEPGPEAMELTPEVVLCPLLAFDDEGWRLGQGGGYYDRTLKALRGRGNLLAVGIAYDMQCVAALPKGPHDQPLDWVVSEKRAMRFERGN